MILLTLLVDVSRAADLELVPSGFDESSVEVALVDGHARRVLERFPSPRIVLQTATSSDGRYAAIIWETLDATPNITVYDALAGKAVNTFESPAYRPVSLAFSTANAVIIAGTCGTSCATFDLLDRAGHSLWPPNAPGGAAYDVSPDSRMAVSYPNPDSPAEGSGVALVSLDDGHLIASMDATTLGDRTVASVAWTSSGARLSLQGPAGKSELTLMGQAGPPPARIDAYPSADAATEMRLTRGANSTKFVSYSAPVRVLDASMSANGKYAAVSSQALGAAPTLTVYELGTGKALSSVRPDGRTTSSWSTKDTLILEWSCGTDCHTLEVRGVDGKPLGKGFAGGVTSTAPSGDYLLFYPNEGSDPVPVELVDLATGAAVAQFAGTNSGALVGTNVTWSADGRAATITLVERTGGAQRALRLSADGTCAWLDHP